MFCCSTSLRITWIWNRSTPSISRCRSIEGTLFLVTHDHDLLEETASRIWRVSAKGIEDFKGAYEELQSVSA
jgi:ABC-type transporter Mla maintaining outer membrane lipid asymmetry ATPase subunit MlaF